MPEQEVTSVTERLIAKNQPAAKVEAKADENISEEEIHSEEQSTEENISQESSTQNDTSLVTKELAESLGIPKGFIGKPLSEVGKSYRASLKEMNENNQRLIQLETNFNELKGQLTQQQAQKAEAQAAAQVKDELGPMPSSFDEPEKFAAWLEKRDEIREAKILKAIEDSGKKLSDSFKNDPTLKQAQELAAKETEKVTLSLLQEGLPKEVDAGKVIDAWFEENKDDYQKLVDSGIYLNKPEKFARDVVNWYKALSFDDLKNKKESDIMKKIHQKTKENLQKAAQSVKVTTPHRQEEKEEPDTVTSRLVRKAIRGRALKNSA